MTQTLSLQSFFHSHNETVTLNITDAVADAGPYKFPRPYERTMWPTTGLCVADAAPDGVSFSLLDATSGFPPEQPLTVTGTYCVATRPLPADGGEARNSPLVDPRAVAVDASGNVYILERSGNALRVVDPLGKIRRVAGTGQAGGAGDGGPARRATLRGPKHLCIDRDGSVLIADTDNHRIRRYLPRAGTIVAVAGSGRKGALGLMQVMPATGRQYGVRDLYDPVANIEAGSKHLKSLLDRFPLTLALAAYNAGEAAVQRFRGVPPYPETESYVSSVLALLVP